MQNALITGSSSGFGLLAAVELARAGLRVFASMRNLERRGRLDDAVRAAGVSVDVIELDVCDEASRQRAIATVEAAGGVDVLVNNAGFGLGGFVHDVELDEYREQFETNFFAVVALTRAALPGMMARRRGRVINVSSISGRTGTPGLSAYVASKFALEGFTESLRLELRPFGLWAVLVEPGTFRTDIFERNRREARKLRDPSSPFRTAVARLEAVVDERVAASKADPRDVAVVIREAATLREPDLRYIVGRDARAQAFLQKILPWSVWERLVLKATRLTDVGSAR